MYAGVTLQRFMKLKVYKLGNHLSPFYLCFFYLISFCMTKTFLFLWRALFRHVLTHEWSQDSGLSLSVRVC